MDGLGFFSEEENGISSRRSEHMATEIETKFQGLEESALLYYLS